MYKGYKDDDYKNIFYLVKNDKLTEYSKYQKLVPYNHILKVMFEPWHTDPVEYTKECLQLISKIPDPLHNIDEGMLAICSYENPIRICDNLECVFFPKQVVDDTNGIYDNDIVYFANVFETLVYNYAAYSPQSNNISFNYSKFNTFYQYFNNLFYNGRDFIRHYNVIFILLCYIYINDADYGIVDQFLSDPDYFNDILKQYNIDYSKKHDNSSLRKTDQELYNMAAFLYTKNKKYIK